MSKKEKSEKVQVTFNSEQLALIRKYKGIFGNNDAEITRNIVMNWIFEKERENKKT